MAERLPVPGPSFTTEERISGRTGRLTAGMTVPSETDDGWWLAHLWLADDAGIVPASDVLPASGPPPGPPLASIGPRLAGALSGLVSEEGGRQLIRLRMPPAADESRPWERPSLCMVAVRWDPVRSEVMSREELGRELVHAWVIALESIR